LSVVLFEMASSNQYQEMDCDKTDSHNDFQHSDCECSNRQKDNVDGSETGRDSQKVIIIGAGPVGLWTAIQIKQRSNNIQVKIYEKYRVYQRIHGLKINTANLHSPHNGQKLKEWIKDLQKGSDQTKTAFISTKDLEDKLLEVAKDLGIEIVYEAINTEERLDALSDECDILIGADGSHSFVRETAFADIQLKKKDLKFIIELKFQIHSGVETESGNLLFDKVKELYPTEKILNFLVEEHIGETRDGGKTKPATLRLFVDQTTYDQLGEVSFKKPKLLKDDWNTLPIKVKEDILKWFAVKQLTEKVINFQPEDCAITKLTISAYRSAKVYENKESRNVVLIGDAAGGVPYFKALNIALKTSTSLADHLLKFFQDHNNNKHLEEYCNYYTKVITKQISEASIKTTALNQVDKFVKISNKVPWQVNKWGVTNKKRIEQIEKHIEMFITGGIQVLNYEKEGCKCGHHQPVDTLMQKAKKMVTRN